MFHLVLFLENTRGKLKCIYQVVLILKQGLTVNLIKTAVVNISMIHICYHSHFTRQVIYNIINTFRDTTTWSPQNDPAPKYASIKSHRIGWSWALEELHTWIWSLWNRLCRPYLLVFLTLGKSNKYFNRGSGSRLEGRI